MKITILKNIIKSYKLLITIFAQLFLLHNFANASSLKISTSQACNFLDDFGLKTQLSWQKDYHQGQWGCGNKNSKNENISPISFTYNAIGNNKEVNDVEIKAQVTDKNYSRLMQKKLIEMSEIISQKTLGKSINQQIKDAINNGKSITMELENYIIKISQEKLSADTGTVTTFKIYSEN